MGERLSKLRDSPVVAVGVGVLVLTLLGGGAATAAKWIDGKRIKPGSVTTKQLRNKSVKTAKLAPGAVGSNQLKNGSVTASKLAPSVSVKGPTGPAGPKGPTGATGPSGSSEVFRLRDQPNFLVSTSQTMIVDQEYPLGAAAYLVNGYLVFHRSEADAVSVSCEMYRVFVDSGGIQTGASELIGTPSTTVPAGGTMDIPTGSATVPLNAVASLASPPPAAAGVEIRILCDTVADDVVVAERQLIAVPFDQLNPN